MLCQETLNTRAGGLGRSCLPRAKSGVSSPVHHFSIRCWQNKTRTTRLLGGGAAHRSEIQKSCSNLSGSEVNGCGLGLGRAGVCSAMARLLRGPTLRPDKLVTASHDLPVARRALSNFRESFPPGIEGHATICLPKVQYYGHLWTDIHE